MTTHPCILQDSFIDMYIFNYYYNSTSIFICQIFVLGTSKNFGF